MTTARAMPVTTSMTAVAPPSRVLPPTVCAHSTRVSQYSLIWASVSSSGPFTSQSRPVAASAPTSSARVSELSATWGTIKVTMPTITATAPVRMG